MGLGQTTRGAGEDAGSTSNSRGSRNSAVVYFPSSPSAASAPTMPSGQEWRVGCPARTRRDMPASPNADHSGSSTTLWLNSGVKIVK